MEWSDNALILRTYPHGETSLVLEVLTQAYGKQRGLFKGAKRKTPMGAYDMGNLVDLRWRGRLETQLGFFTLEPKAHMTAHFFSDSARLMLVLCLCHLLHTLLLDGEAAPLIFDSSLALLEALSHGSYQRAYLCFEFSLLALLGYGITTSSCVATGATADLCYVSPKSWHAVSRSAGLPYHHVLLPLPAFFLSAQAPCTAQDLQDGLRLTTYFLDHVCGFHKKILPPVRRSLHFA